MAYDEQRAFATRPALHNVLHVDYGGQHMYGHEQSIGFQYTNQPPFLPGGFVSPPLTGYAPTGSIHMASPSHRPLPTPRTRPESMPLPVRQFPLVVQAPAPSRPAILASSATLSPSPTAPPARRPLPTPTLARPSTKHAGGDLSARPVSPVKSAINTINTNPDHDLRIPSSFSRRTAPLPDVNQRPLPPTAPPFSTPPPTWPHSSRSETQDSYSAPLWNRNVLAPSSAPIGANMMERRSTVSGVLPPTVLAPAAPPPRPDLRRSESPERTPPAQRPQFSPSRRPLPSSPTEPLRVPSLHQPVPASTEDEYEPPSPSDISSHSDNSYEPMTFADPMQVEDDVEEKIVFAKNTDIPSPKYGIRDLPTRSRIAIANRDDSQNANPFVSDTQEQASRPQSARPATLPQPPASNSSIPQGQSQTAAIPQSPRARMSPPVSSPFTSLSDRSPALGTATAEPQSLTLRFASMGLAGERERERQWHTQQEVSATTSSQSPVRTVPGPISPVRQQQGWPANVPPLPRTPGNNTRPFFGTADVTSESPLAYIRTHDI